MKKLALISFALVLASCGSKAEMTSDVAVFDRNKTNIPIIEWVETMSAGGQKVRFKSSLDQAGADFVKLALRMGQLDGDYVDAYSGPEIWRDTAKAETVEGENLAADIAELRRRLKSIEAPEGQSIRKAQLSKLLRGMAVRLDVIRGKKVSFDKEVSEIYDVKPPVYDLAKYDAILAKIDAFLPGEGTTAERVAAFKNTFEIPKDKLKPVFDRAIAECRKRTQVYYDLPKTEKFRMEFVTDKSWSGYNYYQGNYESLIQINTDFPIIIDRAVDLGCHEGYPGHHVWNLFIERELVGKRGWIEYSVNPLFGPFGPLAEGSGNFGIELAFPGDEKAVFERDVLYPMAELDPMKAKELEALNALTSQLSHATNEISRRYLDGKLTREEAIPLIQKYYLQSYEKSEQRLRFVEKYRGYVINYNIGKDIAKTYVTSAGDTPEAQWNAFRDMLTIPLTPGDIQAKSE